LEISDFNNIFIPLSILHITKTSIVCDAH